MSHGDTILSLGSGFETICSTHDVKFAGFRDVNRPVGAFNFILKFGTVQKGPFCWQLCQGDLRMRG